MNHPTEHDPISKICVIGCSVRPVAAEIGHWMNSQTKTPIGEPSQFQVVAYFDYFADTDSLAASQQIPFVRLSSGSEVNQVQRFLDENFGTGPGGQYTKLHWLLLGGFDLHLEILSFLEISGQVILGRTLEQTVKVKSHQFFIEKNFPGLGPFPKSTRQHHCPPGRWFLKKQLLERNYRDSGRLGDQKLSYEKYWQQGIDGKPISSMHFASKGSPLQNTLLGFSFQVIADNSGYRYLGNFLSGNLFGYLKQNEQWDRAFEIGNRVAEMGLRGLFGIDWILRNGVLWPIELNPRPTATTELYSSWFGQSLYVLNLNSFFNHRPISIGRQATDKDQVQPSIVGKRILYRSGKRESNVRTKLDSWFKKQNDLKGTYSSGKSSANSNQFWYEKTYSQQTLFEREFCKEFLNPPFADLEWELRFADIPPVGQTAENGDPICTTIIQMKLPSCSTSSIFDLEKLFKAFGEKLEQKINLIIHTEKSPKLLPTERKWSC